MQIYINRAISKIKEISLKNYIIISIINSIFGYSIGILAYKFFYEYFGIIFVGVFSCILAIIFSFLNYKIYIFKTPFKYFYSELRKSFLLYFIIFIISIIQLYYLVEILSISIFISQFIVISTTVLISVLGQIFFVFIKK